MLHLLEALDQPVIFADVLTQIKKQKLTDSKESVYTNNYTLQFAKNHIEKFT